ncbi:DUF305 domain-containing protein [Streptomyces sp. NPDC006251]|uniref:DUF305 domain-containing protein n=1 Tax=Streptomyces sp. NPDC006251 TaxID=3155718 RepID=UPI00339ED673
MALITFVRRRPWWLAGAAAILALAVAAVVLVAVRPGGQDTPGEGSADVGFARDMAIHHQQAVELSFIVRDRTDDEDVRRLAYDVINTQANQRGMLLGWLEAWDMPKSSQKPPMSWMDHGHGSMSMPMYEAHDGSLMPGMATNTQLDQLRKADGKAAEVLYLRLLTTHHKGGVEMSQAAADMAGDAKVRRLAEGMVQGQESEMKLMADMLAERGATP